MVEAVKLRKVFSDFWGKAKIIAVDDIDFRLHRQQILGILGPNGSGKTTTLKLLLGLLRPSAGTLRVFDAVPGDLSVKNRIGYLPEESCLYPYFSAIEILEFFGALFNLKPCVRKKRSWELLEMVGLRDAGKRVVGEYSKGMKRRLALAQALINDPDFLILDEPTSGLDPLGCHEIKELLHFLATRGKTILISSHVLSEVESLCDHIMIMYGGRIRAQGSLKELLANPRQSQITVPFISDDKLAATLRVLANQFPPEAIAIGKSPLTLEEFFVKVIHESERTDQQSRQVVPARAIPSFLQP